MFNSDHFVQLQVPGLQPLENMLQLHPIGTDVLHRSRSHRSGDEREVLQSEPAFCRGVFHPHVPVLSGSHLHQHLRCAFFQELDPFHTGLQDKTLIVFCEEKIASFTYDQQCALLVVVALQDLLQLFGGVGPGKVGGLNIDSKGV